MIFNFSLMAAIICVIFLVLKPRRGLLVTIALKSVIDWSWDVPLALSMSLAAIVSIVAVIFVSVNILAARSDTTEPAPLKFFWGMFILNIFAISMAAVMVKGSLLLGFELLFRSVSGALGFYAFYTFYRDEEDFRLLLLAFMVAGFFASLPVLYQVFTGKVWHFRQTVGIIRSVGLYHDAVVVRGYLLPALLATWLYRKYFTKNATFIKRALLLGFILFLSVGLYKIYSKAVVVTITAWLLLFSIHRKYMLLTILSVLLIIVSNLIFSGVIMSEYSRVFYKETDALETGQSDAALAGRVKMWGSVMDRWMDEPVTTKLFGTARNFGAHNEFMRIMIVHGIVGLVIYVWLLLAVFLRLIRRYLETRDDVPFAGLLVMAQYLVECVGQTPGEYSNYQWYLFGMMALGLSGFTLGQAPEKTK